MASPDRERLNILRAQRAVVLCTLALIETAIAAESATCTFKALPDGLAHRAARVLDDWCRANAACDLTVADLREMPCAHELLPGLN